MDLPVSYFKTAAMLRKLHPNWHKDPGCLHEPIFNVSPQNIVVDELHCLLRVTDKLEKGLIFAMVSLDEVVKIVAMKLPLFIIK